VGDPIHAAAPEVAESAGEAPAAVSAPAVADPPPVDLDVILAELVSALDNVRDILLEAAIRFQAANEGEDLTRAVERIEAHSAVVRRRLAETSD
jgi:hypothetical protein